MDFEKLESRDLLAADIQVVYDPASAAEVGEEVTRTIRVFADVDSEVNIRSVLSEHLEDPTWTRFDGYGNKLGPIFTAPTTDLSDLNAEFVRDLGDFNGDGSGDFLFRRPDFEFIVVYGGIELRIGPTLQLPLEGRAAERAASLTTPLGDINGDGFEDVSHVIQSADRTATSLIFGGPSSNQVIDVTDAESDRVTIIEDVGQLVGVGDLDGDGYDDVVIGPKQDSPNQPSYLWRGNAGIQPKTFTSLDDLKLQFAEQLGPVRDAWPIGDFNSDGFQDAVFTSHSNGAPRVVYGGTDIQEIPLPGFNSIDAEMQTWDWLSAYEFAGAGDLNDDGFSDIAFSFDGGDCQCGASGRPNVAGGVVVIHGGKSEVPGQPFQPLRSDNTNIRIDGVSGFLGIRAAIGDIDGDQTADLHITANGIVRETRRNIVIRGGAHLADTDFGHLSDLRVDWQWDGRGHFNGDTIYAFTDVVDLFDFSGDGILDGLVGSQLFLGRSQIPQATGTGDIAEIVTIPAKRSVIYEVTGIVAAELEIDTTAIRVDGQDDRLNDNFLSSKHAVLLELETSDTVTDGDHWEMELKIQNRGPFNAENVVLSESITQRSQEVTWNLSGTPFPDVISLDRIEPGLGATLGGYRTSLLTVEGGFTPEQLQRYLDEPVYRGLGRQVGSLGDTNNDGFDDIYVGYDAPGEDLQFNGSLDFATTKFPQPSAWIGRTSPFDESSDYNGDGLPDTIVHNGNSASILFGTADGVRPDPNNLDGVNGFAITNGRNGFRQSLFADINGDNLDDAILVYTMPGYRAGIVVVYGASGDREAVLPISDVRGNTGFRIDADAHSYEADLTVASNFDFNGDNIDDLLIGDPTAGSFIGLGPPLTGAAYMILGRAISTAQGVGSIHDTLDIPTGSTVTYTLRGTLPPDTELGGTVQVNVSDDQIDLVSAVKEIRIGELPPSIDLTDSQQRLGVENGGNNATGDGDFADLDGDGDLDLFVSVVDGPNQVWLNDGMGNFEDSGQTLGSGQHIYAALGDVDNDGDIDAVVARLGETNELWLNFGDGTFGAAHALLGNVAAASIDLALADLDGDEDLDLFVANSNSSPNEVYLNDGTGRFTVNEQVLGTASSKSVELIDLDGDFHTDAVVANVGADSVVWINDGNAHFEQRTIDTSGEHIAAGDIDSDGDADLIVAQAEANEIWVNNGLGHFEKSAQTLRDGLTSHVALADLDADGDLDAIAANWRDEANRVWLNDGAGHFEDEGYRGDAAFTSEHVAVGDIDGDGDLDLHVAINGSPNRIVVNNLPHLDADINRNGTVDFADFLILSKNFGRNEATREDGDLDNSSQVDFADFLILSADFGKTQRTANQ